MCFQWCRELIKLWRSGCTTSVGTTGEEVWLTMIWTVPTLDSFWPKYHRISMEDRINQVSTLSTSSSACRMDRLVVENRQWYGKCGRPSNSCPNTIGFVCRRELQGCRHSPHHRLLVESMYNGTVDCRQAAEVRSTMIWRDVTMKQLRPNYMCFVWRKQLFHGRFCAQHLCNGELRRLIRSSRKHMCFLW
jgi:hypothetical protein